MFLSLKHASVFDLLAHQPGNCNCSVEKENEAKRLAVFKTNLHKPTTQTYKEHLSLLPREHAVQTLKWKIKPAYTAHIRTFVAHLIRTGECQLTHCTARR